MKFPCEFSLKVMGETNMDLDLAISPILNKYIGDIEMIKFATKESAAGKYQSITVTFTAESQEQLDNIYREITALPNVLMVL